MADVKPKCRLYLQLPASLGVKREEQLIQSLENADIACVLLCPVSAPSDEIQADRLIDLVQAAGAACLIAEDAELAARLGADGVHIGDPEAYARARGLLGQDANIGANCGLSRHDAIVLAEKGADYVAFEAVSAVDFHRCEELIAWWAEMFVVPCVGWNVAGAEDAARLAALGADFVAPPLSIWQSDAPAAAIVEIDRAIAATRRAA